MRQVSVSRLEYANFYTLDQFERIVQNCQPSSKVSTTNLPGGTYRFFIQMLGVYAFKAVNVMSMREF